MSLPSIPQAISVEFLAKKSDNEKRGDKNKTLCGKMKYIVGNITVEPMVFLFIIALMMNILATQNLALEKACRVNLNFNTSICDALRARNQSGYTPFHEGAVQTLVTKFMAYNTIFVGSIPACLMIFLGSWSDRHGRRKPIILMPIFGALLGSIGLLICSHYFLELSLEYSWFCDTFCTSVFGGYGCLALGLYSYVGSISSDENKTLRIGLISVTTTVGMTIGIFISGIAINRLGFIGVYTMTSTMIFIVILYAFCFLKDEKINVLKEKDEGKSFLKDFFAVGHIKATFALCFKQKQSRRKKLLTIAIFTGMMIVGPMHAEMSLVYMYIRLKCGWNEVTYSLFNFIHALIQLAGSSFALTLFSKILKMQDAMLGIIGISSKILACLIYAFGTTGLHFYIGAIFEVFNGTCHLAVRSILAKTVPSHELGQALSVFGICESLMPLAFGPLYTLIYMNTLMIFPGTFYLVSAFMFLIAFSLFTWLYILNKSEEPIYSNKDEPEFRGELLTKKNSSG